ncbi:MAG TPA: hypothetical protein VNZ45_12510 [Bacteroidia bacterium]|jgi:hypothetical protein|nr:hypothetical protein [Bacteroidia bacterium]
MKKNVSRNIVPFNICLLLFICIFYSCKKDPSPPSSSMTASVAGQNTTFGSVYTVYYTHGQLMDIGGQTSGDNFYALKFSIFNCSPSYIGTYTILGTYNNSGPNYNSYATYSYNTAGIDGTYLTPYTYSTDSIHNGVLHITSYDPTYQTISGDFNLTVYIAFSRTDSSKVTIANGNFRAQLETAY